MYVAVDDKNTEANHVFLELIPRISCLSSLDWQSYVTSFIWPGWHFRASSMMQCCLQSCTYLCMLFAVDSWSWWKVPQYWFGFVTDAELMNYRQPHSLIQRYRQPIIVSSVNWAVFIVQYQIVDFCHSHCWKCYLNGSIIQWWQHSPCNNKQKYWLSADLTLPYEAGVLLRPPVGPIRIHYHLFDMIWCDSEILNVYKIFKIWN